MRGESNEFINVSTIYERHLLQGGSEGEVTKEDKWERWRGEERKVKMDEEKGE